jgi:hypothetical protein
LAGGGDRVNAAAFLARYPELAAEVSSAVGRRWLTLFPVPPLEELADAAEVLQSDGRRLGRIVTAALFVAKVITDAMEASAVSAAGVGLVVVLMIVAFDGMVGYVRLLRDARRTRRLMARLEAGAI